MDQEELAANEADVQQNDPVLAAMMERIAQLELALRENQGLPARVAAAVRAAEPGGAAGNRRRPKLKPPEEFNPSKRMDVATWLDQVEAYLASFEGLAAQEGIAYAAALFRGPAATWWRYTRHIFQGDYAAFRTLVKDRFEPINPVKTARDKIAVLRQTNSVQDFTARFMDLRVQIPDMGDADAMDRYLRAVKPRIREKLEEYCSNNERVTLAQMIRYAERMDSVGFQARQSIARETGVPVRRDNGPAPMELGAMNLEEDEESETVELAAVPVRGNAPNRPYNKPPQLTEAERTRRINERLCFHCGQAGHVQRQCPQRRQGNGKGR